MQLHSIIGYLHPHVIASTQDTGKLVRTDPSLANDPELEDKTLKADRIAWTRKALVKTLVDPDFFRWSEMPNPPLNQDRFVCELASETRRIYLF
jgi:hypothetical protein